MISKPTLVSLVTEGADRSPSANPWLIPLLHRIRTEYDEMPGLCLTKPQARRLGGLDSETCDRVFDALVDIGYVRSTARGYVRV